MRIAYPLESCGLFWICPDSGPKPLPLEGVHVSVRVVDLVAEVQVVQFYVNPSCIPIDTKYEFPLDESAAVCGFEAELDDRLLIGQVREKEEARAEYHAAIARGETAALLEQDKADVFVQRIGNIKPYSRINIRITYVADLKVEVDGSVRFVLPTSVAPRYSPYTSHLSWFRGTEYVVIPWRRPWHRCCLGRRIGYRSDYDRVFAVVVPDPLDYYVALPWHEWRYYKPEHVMDKQSPCAFSMTVEVEMPSRVTNITSANHVIRWDPVDGAEGAMATASFWSDTQPMGKDVVLNIHQHKLHEPHVELEVAPDGSGCAMVTMVPEFDLEPEPTEVIFLVDCSGSMRGDRIAAAKRALQLFLRSLPMTCHFNIVKFGTRYTKLFPAASQPYTQATLQEASKHIGEMSASMGGTEILAPLKEIFGRLVAGGGRARQVFVLTDGQVENTESVIEICRQNAHNSRVFSVGIGDEVSRHLVEGMARAATGTAEFIQGHELKGSSGILESKLINQLKNATLPSITKIMIDWGTLGPLTPGVTSDHAASQEASAPTHSETSTSSTSSSVSSGGKCLLTFRVRCEQTETGEDLYVTGSCSELGQWDPSGALKMYTNAHVFPIWATTTSVNANEPIQFKFLKKKSDGYMAFENFDGKRSVTPLGSECTAECGQWNVWAASPVLTNVVATTAPAAPAVVASTPPPAPAPTPAIAAPPAAAPTSGPRCPVGHELHVSNYSEGAYLNGWVCDRCGRSGPAFTDRWRCFPCGFDVCFYCVPSQAPSVSKFFQTGPGQQHRPGMMSFVGSRTGAGSIHGVGTGPGFHAPNTLAPAVGAYHDASSAQAQGRNESVYQAPFLPPPVFSGTKFVMYALFAPGKLPTGAVRIVAEAPQGQLVIDVPVTKLSTTGKTLHVLAARALIRDLEEGTSHLHWRKSDIPAHLRGGGSGEREHRWFCGWLSPTPHPVAIGGAGQDRGSAWKLEPVTPPAHVVRAEMIDLGIRFGITSSVTSFIAVERFRDGSSGTSAAPLPLPSQQSFQLNEPRSHGMGPPLFSAFSGAPPGRGGPGRFSGFSPSGPLSSSKSSSSSISTTSSFSMAGPPPPMAAPPSFGDLEGGSWGGPRGGAFGGGGVGGGRGRGGGGGGWMNKSSAPAAPRMMAQPQMRSRKGLSSDKEKKAKNSAPKDRFSSEMEDFDSFDLPPPTDAFDSALLLEQNFDGSFDPTPTVCSILGVAKGTFESGASTHAASFGAGTDAATALRLWTCVMILAHLRNRWASQESTWSMVADKARSWCMGVLAKGLGVDRAEARRLVEQFVSSV